MTSPPPRPSARPGPRGPKEKARLRRDIINAAAELFAVSGYQNISMRKIADRVGFTPMAIYNYFEDKEDLLDCICEEAYLKLYRTHERLWRIADPEERLGRSMTSFIDFALKHPHHYRAIYQRPPSAAGASGRRVGIRAASQALKRAEVAAFLGREESSLEVQTAVHIVMMAETGLVGLFLATPPSSKDRARLIDAMVGVVLRGLKG